MRRIDTYGVVVLMAPGLKTGSDDQTGSQAGNPGFQNTVVVLSTIVLLHQIYYFLLTGNMLGRREDQSKDLFSVCVKY